MQHEPRRIPQGFSLLELLVVVALMGLVSAFAVISGTSASKYQRADTALQITLSQMRLARDFSVDKRKIHRVTLNTPSSVTLERFEDGDWRLVSTVPFPGQVVFGIEPGAPSGESAPEGFDVDDAIDFNESNQLLFKPDGSAVDALGRAVNGIAYLSWPGEVDTARAITLFGATGRSRGWKVVRAGEGGLTWK